MTRRFSFLAALALVASFATGADAQTSAASLFSNFTPLTSSVSYTRSADASGLPAVLSASSTGIFSIPSTGVPFLSDPSTPNVFTPATLSLTAVSSSTASGAAQGGFTGSFSIMSGSTNLLSGTFTAGILSQEIPSQARFESNQVTYTSDIFLPTFQEDFLFGLSGGFTNLIVSGGAFQNFRANGINGAFNALVVPEPATLAMAGLGIFALPLAVRAARRRRSVEN